MLGNLSKDEIDRVLHAESLGRIGCHAEGRTYVVPVTYAYDGEDVYARSADGLKIRTMRANPHVCFEVEQVVDAAHWRTVIAWGDYEELRWPQEDRAAALLRDRFGSAPVSETAQSARKIRTILFRLRLTEKAGRFEDVP
jgi:nitroimidazol reductase NimA-like FMN-containing flavoprotein (pyridoxamine 5'-phosphate oxidase superfamily)